MKGRLWLPTAIAAAVLLAFGSVAVDAAPRSDHAGPQVQGVWVGHNSQGFKLKFLVVRSRSGLHVAPQELDFLVTCSGSGQQFMVGAFFSGFLIRVRNHHFQFREFLPDDPFPATFFEGTFNADNTSATGTELFAYPAFTKDLDLETCSSGNVTWTAHPSRSQDQATLDLRILLTRDPDGHLSVTMSR